jgi:FAD/FMN-containing dehydrogenase
MLDTMSFDQFSENFHGRMFKPGDRDYEEARTIYNAAVDKKPAVIARCANVADVIAAVNFARANKLDTAIRSGGHNGPGFALVDDGLVIDLSTMKGIRVDTDAKKVRVEPGCSWRNVDHATHAFGLATVSGIIGTTGVPGLTLGGGHDYLTRKHGLTIDNLLSADVVLADGQLVHASARENPDLFWALRGGGGNFGVVTSFQYRLHPVDTVIAGPMFWPIDHLEKTLCWYREWLPKVHRDIYAFYLVAEVPTAAPFPTAIHGHNVCGLMWCCTGGQEQADTMLPQARDVAMPIFEFVGPLPYPAVQGMFDSLYPAGLNWHWKGDFVREIPNDAVAMHRRFGEVPTGQSTMHLYPIDGAVNDVAVAETAWAFRDATWSMVMAGVDPDPANKDKIAEWSRSYWEALHPYSAGGAYVNFMMEEGVGRVQATYGPNYERLRIIKAKYDPHNFFHVNQNITPSDAGAG